MTTPASFNQYVKLHDVLNHPSSESFQNFLANGDLLLQMACVDLSKVDRSAFEAALTPMPALIPWIPLIPWTPVDEYVDRIMARSQLRGWGFTSADADELSAKLHNHDGLLTPTGAKLWLGKNLGYNWNEIMSWINEEVRKLGFTFQARFHASGLSFYPGSEVTGKRRLDVVDLDLATFLNPTNGVVPKDVRSARPKWPGLEVATLLALNPQICIAMNSKTIPYMLAAGLVVGSDYLPRFYRIGREVYVDNYSNDTLWTGTSVVAFRE